MTSLLVAAVLALAMILLVPVFVLFVQCLAAVLPARRVENAVAGERPKLAVLVPAHNEAVVIAKTLQSISAQLGQDDRLIVIADNCTDRTAQIAARHGAEVHERNEPERRGKGYALELGLRTLAADPPRVVVVIDADCTLEADCLTHLAVEAVRANRPVQGAYLMPPPAVGGFAREQQSTISRAGANETGSRPEKPVLEGASRPIDVVSSLAVLVKNRVRPRGMARLGFPCLLTGSGMAFPWDLHKQAVPSGAQIVEDMQLSIDLALAGSPPRFCERAVLSAPLPGSRRAAVSQRRRWEHGHLQALFTQAPRLLAEFFRRPRVDLLAMMFDLTVPPLSLLTLLWALLLGASLWLGVRLDWWLPGGLLILTGALLAGGVGMAWLRFGRRIVPLAALLTIPAYMASKLPLYVSFLFNRQRSWVRTDRGSK